MSLEGIGIEENQNSLEDLQTLGGTTETPTENKENDDDDVDFDSFDDKEEF